MFSGRTKGCFESPPYLDQVTKIVVSRFISVILFHIFGCGKRKGSYLNEYFEGSFSHVKM